VAASRLWLSQPRGRRPRPHPRRRGRHLRPQGGRHSTPRTGHLRLALLSVQADSDLRPDQRKTSPLREEDAAGLLRHPCSEPCRGESHKGCGQGPQSAFYGQGLAHRSPEEEGGRNARIHPAFHVGHGRAHC